MAVHSTKKQNSQRCSRASTCVEQRRGSLDKLAVKTILQPLHSPMLTTLPIADNIITGVDHEVAAWFHAHLTHAFAGVLQAMSQPGSDEWLGIVSFFAVAFLAWKRRWHGLLTFVLVVPCGALLNEGVKLLVHRHRPFVEGWFVDWTGYSFTSGHTIAATLLYGLGAVVAGSHFRVRHWRALA